MMFSKECFGRTRAQLSQTKEFMVDKLCSTIESVPRLCRSYCCVCCYYRRRKSIGVTQENNQKSAQGTPVIPITAVNGEYNKSALQSQSNGNSVAPSPANETPPVTPQSQPVLESTPKEDVKRVADDHNGNTVETWSNENVSRQATPKEREDDESREEETSRPVSTPKTTLVTTMQSSPNGIDLNSSVDEVKEAPAAINAALPDGDAPESSSAGLVVEPISPEKEDSPGTPRPSSTLSKAESVKAEEQPDKPEEEEPANTADTPDYESQAIETISRPQSVVSTKSQVIEEELDCEPSIIEPDRTSEVTQEVLEDLSDVEDTNPAPNVPSPQDSPIKELPVDPEPELFAPSTPELPPSPPKSPTIAEIKALSRKSSFAKSNESLFERPHSKLDIDNSTETSSDYQSSHLNNTLTEFIPVKPQHIPLQRKSKTSYFMKNHRRVSPVKQSIKMTQAELFPPNMTRFDKPRDALHKTFDQLDSPNWEVMVMGLKSMVRLMRYHPDTLDNQMHMTCIQLTKSVRNLRSQVSRAACQASTELFTMKSKYLEQECDDLVSALLHRTADTNRFLRADATRGLESMCDNLTPPKVLNILSTRGAVHQNALVRTTTAKLLNRLADRLGCEKIFSMGRDNRDKFILTGANLLLEGSLETRSYAKALFRMLSDHPNYTRLLQDVIPARTYRNIEKTLKNIR